MNATVPAFSAIDAAVEELLNMARAEVDDWDELAARANGLRQRFHTASGSIQSATRDLQTNGIRAVSHVTVELAQQIDVLRIALQASADEADDLAQRAEAVLARFNPGGDVAEGMVDLQSIVAMVTDATGTAMDELADSVVQTTSHVLDELPTRGTEISQALSARLVDLGNAFDEEMAAVITESIDDFEEALTEEVDTTCTLLNEAGETLREGVDAIVDETQSKLTELGNDWRDGMNSLESSYSRLGEDLAELGDDIRSTYSLVVDGMSGASVGANAAGCALTDVQSLMSGVS